MVTVLGISFLTPDAAVVAVERYELDVVSAAGMLCAATSRDSAQYNVDEFEFDGPSDEIAILNSLMGGIEDKFFEAIQSGSNFGKEEVCTQMLKAFAILEDDFKVGLELRLKDLVAAIQLFREGVCTFREAVEIAKM